MSESGRSPARIVREAELDGRWSRDVEGIGSMASKWQSQRIAEDLDV